MIRVLGPRRVLGPWMILCPRRVLGPHRVLGPRRVLGPGSSEGFFRYVMKGDPSNIYCTKNCFAVKLFCTVNIISFSTTDCVNSLSLEKLSRFTFFSHSCFARNSSGNANVEIGILVNANKNLTKTCSLQERSIEFYIIAAPL